MEERTQYRNGIKKLAAWFIIVFLAVMALVLLSACSSFEQQCVQAGVEKGFNASKISVENSQCCYTLGTTGEMCRTLEQVKNEGFKPKFE